MNINNTEVVENKKKTWTLQNIKEEKKYLLTSFL